MNQAIHELLEAQLKKGLFINQMNRAQAELELDFQARVDNRAELEP